MGKQVLFVNAGIFMPLAGQRVLVVKCGSSPPEAGHLTAMSFFIGIFQKCSPKHLLPFTISCLNFIAATDEEKYTFTKDIDTSNIQLLCTTSSNTALSDIKWGYFDNPLVFASLPNQYMAFNCRTSSTNILQVDIMVQGEYSSQFY